jgi:hypothetical protein
VYYQVVELSNLLSNKFSTEPWNVMEFKYVSVVNIRWIEIFVFLYVVVAVTGWPGYVNWHVNIWQDCVRNEILELPNHFMALDEIWRGRSLYCRNSFVC